MIECMLFGSFYFDIHVSPHLSCSFAHWTQLDRAAQAQIALDTVARAERAAAGVLDTDDSSSSSSATSEDASTMRAPPLQEEESVFFKELFAKYPSKDGGSGGLSIKLLKAAGLTTDAEVGQKYILSSYVPALISPSQSAHFLILAELSFVVVTSYSILLFFFFSATSLSGTHRPASSTRIHGQQQRQSGERRRILNLSEDSPGRGAGASGASAADTRRV